MKRSLVASLEGIKRARVALKRQKLTQKALAYEFAIASWATVSKFFNGKPIDRNLFLEICERLDLDWQDIAAPFLVDEEESRGEEEISPELAAIQRNSQDTRTALDPYILPRIRREALLEKCMTVIRRGVEGQRRVIPILGAAGYGKSTLLGSIYDELESEFTSSNKGWVALARCNDFIESLENFPLEVGEKVSGSKKSIVEIATLLTEIHGRGVLLIDTLDLVLESKLVPVLRRLFFQLLEVGVTIVFTCRDHDYQDFFTPYPESFAGFFESIERHFVNKFDTNEVRAATTAFVQSLGIDSPEGGEDFAAKIINLSANSQSLAEITHNPLLLALLCDLFAKDENVPEDLTVSQLYEKFWHFRIAQGRKHHTDARRIGMAKRNLCFKLAQIMYNNSGERLRDFVFESQLELDETQFQAYSELKSDGVLADIGGERIGFFHQTFLEYAIARWIDSTPKGEAAKNELLQLLSTSENPYAKHYIWSVLRQLLNLVNLEEFYHLANNFDQKAILPFRTIALASVSHQAAEASQILHQILPIAWELGDSYQDTLLIASKSATNRHIENAWIVILELLTKCSLRLTNQAALTAGEMLSRFKVNPGEKIDQALKAIEQRPSVKSKDGVELHSSIFAQLISSYAQVPKTFGGGIDADVCQALRKQYFNLSSKTRSQVVQLHSHPTVPFIIQREFILHIISQPVRELHKERDNAIIFFHQVLPNLITSGDSVFGNSWLSAIHTHLQADWGGIIATVIGEQAVGDTELLQILITKLLQITVTNEDKQYLHSYQVVVLQAIKSGGANEVIRLLLSFSIIDIPANRYPSLFQLVSELAKSKDELNDEAYDKLAQWILPITDLNLKLSIGMLNVISINSATTEELFWQILENKVLCLNQSEINKYIKNINYIPPQLERYLENTSNHPESRLALIKLYRQNLEDTNSQEALLKLLQLCCDKVRDVALAAIQTVLDSSHNGNYIQFADLLPVISHSKFMGVRQKTMFILKYNIDAGWMLSEVEFLTLYQSLESENAIEIIQPWWQIIGLWVDYQRYIPLNVAKSVFTLIKRFINERKEVYLEGAIANISFSILKYFVNIEDANLYTDLCDCTRQLIITSSLTKTVNYVNIIALLARLGRVNQEFFTPIIQEDLVKKDMIIPLINQRIIVAGIVQCQGKNSPLLDEMLNDERFSEDVKNHILREREV
ncbi:NACHT domain-containing protein [Tolypothrix sp. VBCCA 56010]|uniref:NACHT domain-containing protein n=1 Tax=Tolypothrix sp. VBCCA 56010 TaxID=3137731 RepID=UPI003D7ED169